ncbi:MAG: GNAT family N-acetyltransferase [Acidobacteriota bacterium]
MPRLVERVWLEPFDPERDVVHLAAWVRAPHVARWWGDPETQLPAVLERPAGGGDALIVADAVPVGYIRWQRAPRDELEAAGLHEIPAGTVDIDIAIGEVEYVGCGIASRALTLVVENLAVDRSIPMVMMATSVENTMAISAFEKAGFRRLRKFEDPEYGPMWVFSLDMSARA